MIAGPLATAGALAWTYNAFKAGQPEVLSAQGGAVWAAGWAGVSAGIFGWWRYPLHVYSGGESRSKLNDGRNIGMGIFGLCAIVSGWIGLHMHDVETPDHPNPLPAGVSSPPPASTPETKGCEITYPLPSGKSESAAKLQIELKRHGMYPARVDGIPGKVTKAGERRYAIEVEHLADGVYDCTAPGSPLGDQDPNTPVYTAQEKAELAKLGYKP